MWATEGKQLLTVFSFWVNTGVSIISLWHESTVGLFCFTKTYCIFFFQVQIQIQSTLLSPWREITFAWYAPNETTTVLNEVTARVRVESWWTKKRNELTRRRRDEDTETNRLHRRVSTYWSLSRTQKQTTYIIQRAQHKTNGGHDRRLTNNYIYTHESGKSHITIMIKILISYHFQTGSSLFY